MKNSVVVLIILLYGFISSVKAYNRSLLQQKYPGFGDDFIFVSGPDNKPTKLYLTEEEPADPDSVRSITTFFDDFTLEDIKVTFTFYSRHMQEGNRGYIINNVEDMSGLFDRNESTKFITHGWASSGEEEMCQSIKDGVLYKYDANVFIVDWSSINKYTSYTKVRRAIPYVGFIFSNFIQGLIDHLGANPYDIHIVGHSLGAHLAGFAGRNLRNTRIGRITGLDPAKPGFDNFIYEYTGGLNKNDALFVDVIHTCGNFLGLFNRIGDVDFYPNGGTAPQPGCTSSMMLEMIEACSHGRSWQLFANSFRKVYMASKCDVKSCNTNEYIKMGDGTPPFTKGIYYIETSKEPPYL